MWEKGLKIFKHLLILSVTLSMVPACSGKSTRISPAPKPPQVLTVAVLPFEDHSISHSPETLGLARTVADRISEQLFGVSGISLIDRESIDQLLSELSLSSKGITNEEGRLQLGQLLGVHYLLMGEYSEIFGNLRLDARFVEVQSGEIVGSYSMNGTVAERPILERSFSEKTSRLFLKKTGKTTFEPKSSQDYLQLGLKYEQENNIDQAMMAYQKALSINPENQRAKIRMETLMMMAIE